MDVSALVSLVISAGIVGFFGALKFYANTLGPNPESFELKKFAPFMIIGILISIAMLISQGLTLTPDQVMTYISENFILVMFANVVLTIIEKKFSILQ